MKLRIQDDSVRFRITLRELEELQKAGELECRTHIPNSESVFRYAVRRTPDLSESRLLLAPFSFSLNMCDKDFAQLAGDGNEGVYIRREWRNDNGEMRRFMVFIEKDRPGAVCEKPEAWVYESNPGGVATTRPAPPATKAPQP